MVASLFAFLSVTEQPNFSIFNLHLPTGNWPQPFDQLQHTSGLLNTLEIHCLTFVIGLNKHRKLKKYIFGYGYNDSIVLFVYSLTLSLCVA